MFNNNEFLFNYRIGTSLRPELHLKTETPGPGNYHVSKDLDGIKIGYDFQILVIELILKELEMLGDYKAIKMIRLGLVNMIFQF